MIFGAPLVAVAGRHGLAGCAQNLDGLNACWIRAASGGCIVIGSIIPPWPIYWVRISGWRPRMRYTVAWTGCWNIKQAPSII